MISLARTPGRLESFRTDNVGLEGWSVFPAIDGRTVDAATRDALGDTALWSQGGVGAALSHIALWRLCVSLGTPLTICEDDAVLRRDFSRASAALLGHAPGYDLVVWGWNLDSVMEAELAPGVPAAVLGDQVALRSAVGPFREQGGAPSLLKLHKALGMACYTLSPAGASALLARALPVRGAGLVLPLMPREIGNVTFDVTVASLYGQLLAYVAVPPLAVTRNEWSLSTVRLGAEPLAAADALTRADALQSDGHLEEAVTLIQAAAAAAPNDAALWSRLGLLLAEQGRLAAAAAALERACSMNLGDANATYNLARVRLLQNRPQEALDLLDQTVACAADFPAAHTNRGVALLALDRTADAQAAFREAVRLQPRLLEAQRGLAATCAALGDTAGAIEAQAAALALAPGDAALLDGLALLQLQRAARVRSEGHLAEAAQLASLAARAPSRRFEALVTASDLLEQLGRFEESWAQAHEATRLDPASPHALINLGVACLRLNRPVEAEQAYRAAVALAPTYADAHHGLAFALLKQGRYIEGWPEYEWRLRTPQAVAWAESFDRPLWRGDARPDATLLLAAEQGLGDTLQAACLIAEARQRVGHVIVQASCALANLLRRMPGVDAVVEQDAPHPTHDVWLPMMSLPGRLGVTLERRPPVEPPLAADPTLTAMWRERLPREGLRIGVAWQGNRSARVEHGRSFPLAAMEPLAAAPGVALVSLQKGFGVEQLGDRPTGLRGLTDLGEPYRAGDFDHTAAVIANLDAVVCCDTAIAHLAGALGRRVWIALGDNPDWRWPAKGEDTPWYASARLFRRSSGEAWANVMARMAPEVYRLRAD